MLHFQLFPVVGDGQPFEIQFSTSARFQRVQPPNLTGVGTRSSATFRHSVRSAICNIAANWDALISLALDGIHP